MKVRILAVAVASLACGTALADVRSGGEIPLSPVEPAYFSYPGAVAVRPDGSFVVVWTRLTRNGALGYGRGFQASGSPVCDVLQLGSETVADDVAVADDSSFIVSWSDLRRGDAYVQRFDANCNRMGEEIRVDAMTLNQHRHSSLAIDRDGSFVVTWTDTGNQGDLNDYRAFAQRFDSAGNRLGSAFAVALEPPGFTGGSMVEMLGGGAFVIAWAADAGSGLAIRGQRFDSTGNRLGEEFTAISMPNGGSVLAFLSSNALGDFVVGGEGIREGWVRSYDGGGMARGDALAVAGHSARLEAVALSESGEFIVTMSDIAARGDGSGEGVLAQRFSAGGEPIGGRFLVNSSATGDQYASAIGMAPNGRYVIAWGIDRFDDFIESSGVSAQRYRNGSPPVLSLGLSRDRVTEGRTTRVLVELSEPATEGIEVPFDVVGGDRTDFLVEGLRAVLRPGDVRATLALIHAVDDAEQEDTETLDVRIRPPADGRAAVGDDWKRRIRIVDND